MLAKPFRTDLEEVGGLGFGISRGLSVSLLFFFNHSYEIHLHALPMQSWGDVLQVK